MAICAGAGGLELGLRIALDDDYRCVVYVEREAYAAATLVARMADQTLDTAPVWDDVSTFDGRPWRGRVDLISAGFSCQPWSDAGKKLGIEDERWLWPDIARIVREVGPEWVFLENVAGLVRGGLEHVLRDLAAEGFDAEWDCVSAAEVGAPHLRQRLFILAQQQSGLFDGLDPLVADGDSEGLVVERGPAGIRQCDADGCDRTLADAHECRHTGWAPESRWCPFWGAAPPGAGELLGDAEYAGRQRVPSPDDERKDDAGSRAEPERPRSPLGDASGGRLRVGRRSGSDVSDTADQYWPPDRSFAGDWPSELEPAVRRVADGMAPWVDRLRLTGNGVVPLAAAVAFLRLRARLTA